MVSIVMGALQVHGSFMQRPIKSEHDANYPYDALPSSASQQSMHQQQLMQQPMNNMQPVNQSLINPYDPRNPAFTMYRMDATDGTPINTPLRTVPPEYEFDPQSVAPSGEPCSSSSGYPADPRCFTPSSSSTPGNYYAPPPLSAGPASNLKTAIADIDLNDAATSTHASMVTPYQQYIQRNPPTCGFDLTRQVFMSYFHPRGVAPSYYFGGRPIPVLSENIAAPNISLPPPLTTIEQVQDKQTLMGRIKTILKATQLHPKGRDSDALMFEHPAQRGEMKDWCRIFYYEFEQRIGETYKPDYNYVIVDGLCAPSNNTRFCLGAIGNPSRDPLTIAIRRQLGKGIKIINNNNNIFVEVYAGPVFVQANLLSFKNGDHFSTVYRATAGHSMEVFDHDLFKTLVEAAASTGDVDRIYELMVFCQIRIAFIKGWGSRYRRAHITNTPCWVEIQLPLAMELVDDVLKQCSGSSTDVHSWS